MSSKSIYCTYITFYSGNKLPPFYIGSSNVAKVESGYHGSIRSKKWKDIYYSELKQNPNLFSTEIVATFETRQEATAYELELQIANNVVKSKWFFNESLASINGSFGRDVSGNLNPNYGNHIRLSNGFTGHKHSEETRKFLSENHPRHMLGKHHSDITKKKMSKPRNKSDKMILACKENGIKAGNIPKNDSHKNNISHALKNIKDGQCPHCGKIGKLMGRFLYYHFDNCKLTKEIFK